MTSFLAGRDDSWDEGFSARGASAQIFNREHPAPSGQPRKVARESGYAMLLVFLLAAIIALALYSELPRVAFEAQRAKEQLLIERGEQYKRAIQLFVRKVGRYPATIEELESLNNIRFLRKRYLDPMTGKEKWRLIHINGGVLTDSIIPKNKPGQDHQQQANTNTFIGEGPVMGAPSDPNHQQINPAMHRRASDGRPVVTQEAPDQPALADADQQNLTTDNSDSSNTNDATVAPGTTGTAANTPGMPNQQTPGMPPGSFQQPGNSGPVGNGGLPNNAGQSADQSSSSSVYVAPSLGQSYTPNTVQMERMLHGDYQPPGSPRGQPGMFPNQNPDTPQSGLQGQSSGGLGQSGPGGASTGATGQNPNGGFGGSNFGPAGSSSMQPAGGLPGIGGTQIGGGIAGVASESTGPAIIVYNERKKYNEWEFVYDQSKDRGLAGVQRNGGAPGTPAQSLGSSPGQQPGVGGPAGSSGFGQPTPQQPQPQSQQPPN